MWFKLAERLGMSVARTMREVSSREFVLWVAKFDDEHEEFNPTHWYLAQIAYEVYASRLRRRVGSIKQFLLSFTRRRPMTLEEAAAASKAAWRQRLGQEP